MADVEKERSNNNNQHQYASNTYQSNVSSAMQLELPKRRGMLNSSSSEDEDRDTPSS